MKNKPSFFLGLVVLLLVATSPLRAAVSPTVVTIDSPTGARAQCPTSSLTVNVFDGTRQLVPEGTELLVRIFDGRHKQIVSGFYRGPMIRFDGLPLQDDFSDYFTVVVSRPKYLDGGIAAISIKKGVVSVRIDGPAQAAEIAEATGRATNSPVAEADSGADEAKSNDTQTVHSVDVMLIPQHAFIDFSQASASELKEHYGEYWRIISSGAASDEEAQARWNRLLAKRPLSAMCLLNILTAMSQFHFSDGQSPIVFYKEIIWDKTLAQDRFFAWVEPQYIHELELGTQQGAWQQQVVPGILHPGATRAWKQAQLENANLNPTAHENDIRVIDGRTYVLMETDIDFYKDKLAHIFLEVIPNLVVGGLTDPRLVYQLRWNAGASIDLPSFAPPYVVLPASREHPECSKSHEHRDLKNIIRWPDRSIRGAFHKSKIRMH